MGLSPVFISVTADLGLLLNEKSKGKKDKAHDGPRLSRSMVLGHSQSPSSIPQGEGKGTKPFAD